MGLVEQARNGKWKLTVYKIVIKRSERKWVLERPRCRWRDGVKMELTD